MKLRSLLITLLFPALFLFAGSIQAETAEPSGEQKLVPKQQEELLSLLEENLKASKTLQAKFVQEKHLSLFRDVLVSRGLLAFAVPSRLRWEITEPFHSLLLMNGSELAKYDFSGGKPRRLKLPAADALYEVMAQIAGLHQGKFGEEAKNYELQLYRGESVRLVLVPKNKKMKQFIQGIEIKFSKTLDSVSSVVIREGGDDFTLITFGEVSLNPALPDSLFALDLK
jgi:outer membrane lipoprotein-sorting protein